VNAAAPLHDYLLRLGDDALIAAQRLAEWCACAPEMEEDVALTNIALDQLGAARLLLSYAGELASVSRQVSEDDLAYLRDDKEFRNCLLVELPNGAVNTPAGRTDAGDFAVTIGKLLFLSAYQVPLYRALAGSADERLAGIAAKTVKESSYHLDHSALWTVRLGDGTEESHRRMQDAVDGLWPYTHELFMVDESGLGVDPSTLRDEWLSTVEQVLSEATLVRPADGWAPSGGREGRHTEHLPYLLTEMQVVHRAHPGASW
jgi:ring-1,2-phenylacetyl-CoA epoxidase subunit PaaC